MKSDEFALVVRRYPTEAMTRGPFVDVWLSIKAHWGWAALISGPMHPDAFESLAKALQIKVVEDPTGTPFSQICANDRPDCVPASEQKTLFDLT